MKINILKITSVIFLLTFLLYGCSANNEEFTKKEFDISFKNMELIPDNINIEENSKLNLNITSDINGKLQIIGPNQVSIPEYYYKVILDYSEPELKGIGFILKNQKSSDPISKFAVTIDEVEEITGIDFFHSLPDAIENEIELKYDMKKWILN